MTALWYALWGVLASYATSWLVKRKDWSTASASALLSIGCFILAGAFIVAP